jgi:hypothetical protein
MGAINVAHTALITDKLLATLKRHNPAKVRAYAGDDDARDIAVPTRRKRWAQVIEAIDAKAWSRVELLDKSAAVLAYVENTGPAADVEDFEPGRVSKTRADAEWIVTLVVRAQREAMAFRDSEVQSLLRAQGDVVRELSRAMQDLSGIYTEQRRAAVETAEIRAAAHESGSGGEWKELLDAAPQLLQMLPLVRQLVSPTPQPNKPKNGA